MFMKKKMYLSPRIDFFDFSSEDVIATSESGEYNNIKFMNENPVESPVYKYGLFFREEEPYNADDNDG